ncbi:hypothetical protein [Streptomyces decoyicus]|uniref:hypothetical protein n=1 Tax=Streptomyces decoyicus TaxID=249567 RepID=UPI0033BB590D
MGEFEVHLTVRDDGDRGVAGALAAYAAAHRLTCVHILLEQGDVPSQPMLTLHGSGTYEKVRAEAAARADGLRAAGFDVVRTKIEATPGAGPAAGHSVDGRSRRCPGGQRAARLRLQRAPPAPAEPAEIRGPQGTAPVVVHAATRALSLAWKVLWLVSDMHPEGKDLYDAVLLAESTELPFALLREVFRGVDGGSFDRHPVLLETLYGIERDWSELRKEYPDRTGLMAREPGAEYEYVERLVAALAPTFAFADGSGSTAAYQQRAAWFESLTAECAGVLAERGRDAVQDLLLERNVTFDNTVVITRELSGRDRCALRDAAAVVAAFRRAHPAVGRRTWLLADPDEVVQQLSAPRGETPPNPCR